MEEAGPNVLARDSRGGIPRILWRQINDPLMYVLLGSGTLAVLLGKAGEILLAHGPDQVLRLPLPPYVTPGTVRSQRAIDPKIAKRPLVCSIRHGPEHWTVSRRPIAIFIIIEPVDKGRRR